MKFTVNWLKKYLDCNVSTTDLVKKLNSIGIEVESVVDYKEKLSPFTLAYIKSAEPHPDADKLKVCNVETHLGELQIVCGASNARAGIYVIFAPENSFIPGLGITLKKASIRGVESNGMMVSEKEIQVSEEHGKIIEFTKEQLPLSCEIGTPAYKVLGMEDAIIEISITPNRGDLLGVRGVAKDLSATGLGELKLFHVGSYDATGETITINKDSAVSQKFCARKIVGLQNKQSPKWIQDHLNHVGIKPRSAIVDITNYVMLCLNQPLHAYDVSDIKDSNIYIEVAMAKQEEDFTTLDDASYKIDNQTPMVIFNNKNEAIAGIKGGSSRKCTENTTDIILESAIFDNKIIAYAKRRLNINTDSAYRFERETDINTIEIALDYATDLILQYCGGKVVETAIAKDDIKVNTIEFDLTYLNTLSGINFSVDKVFEILEGLGFASNYSGKFIITPPSYRNDIKDKCDVVAEIIRIYGVDNIPSYDLSPMMNKNTVVYDDVAQRLFIAKRAMAKIGFYETVNMSFISEKSAIDFELTENSLHVHNPISIELAVMRRSIIQSLVMVATENIKKGNPNFSIFEVGKIYSKTTEENSVAGLISGNLLDKTWNHEAVENSVWEIKKTLGSLLESLGFSIDNLTIIQNDLPSYYHSYRSASINMGKTVIGYFGEINPILANKLDVKTSLSFFELFLDKLPMPKNKSTVKSYLHIPDVMPIKRDFAFVVEDSITAGEIIRIIKSVDKKVITNVSIFDVYQGVNLPDNKKSIAVSVLLQSDNKSFVDSEIQDFSNKIIDAVSKKLNASLR